MPEYRITTNGDRYRIEKRGFLGRWQDAAYSYLPSRPPRDGAQLGAWLKEPLYFGWMQAIGERWDTRSLEETEETLRLLLEFEAKEKEQKAKKWRSL
jgi:hypothetical protein